MYKLQFYRDQKDNKLILHVVNINDSEEAIQQFELIENKFVKCPSGALGRPKYNVTKGHGFIPFGNPVQSTTFPQKASDLPGFLDKQVLNQYQKVFGRKPSWDTNASVETKFARIQELQQQLRQSEQEEAARYTELTRRLDTAASTRNMSAPAAAHSSAATTVLANISFYKKDNSYYLRYLDANAKPRLDAIFRITIGPNDRLQYQFCDAITHAAIAKLSPEGHALYLTALSREEANQVIRGDASPILIKYIEDASFSEKLDEVLTLLSNPTASASSKSVADSHSHRPAQSFSASASASASASSSAVPQRSTSSPRSMPSAAPRPTAAPSSTSAAPTSSSSVLSSSAGSQPLPPPPSLAQQGSGAVSANIYIFKRDNKNYVSIQYGLSQLVYKLELGDGDELKVTSVNGMTFTRPSSEELSAQGTVKIENYMIPSAIFSELERLKSAMSLQQQDLGRQFEAIRLNNTTFNQAISLIKLSLIEAKASSALSAASASSSSTLSSAASPRPAASAASTTSPRSEIDRAGSRGGESVRRIQAGLRPSIPAPTANIAFYKYNNSYYLKYSSNAITDGSPQSVFLKITRDSGPGHLQYAVCDESTVRALSTMTPIGAVINVKVASDADFRLAKSGYFIKIIESNDDNKLFFDKLDEIHRTLNAPSASSSLSSAPSSTVMPSGSPRPAASAGASTASTTSSSAPHQLSVSRSPARESSEAVKANIYIFNQDKINYVVISVGATQYKYKLNLDSQNKIRALRLNSSSIQFTRDVLSNPTTVKIENYNITQDNLRGLQLPAIDATHDQMPYLQTIMRDSADFQAAMARIEQALIAAKVPPTVASSSSSVLSSEPHRPAASVAVSVDRSAPVASPLSSQLPQGFPGQLGFYLGTDGISGPVGFKPQSSELFYVAGRWSKNPDNSITIQFDNDLTNPLTVRPNFVLNNDTGSFSAGGSIKIADPGSHLFQLSTIPYNYMRAETFQNDPRPANIPVRIIPPASVSSSAAPQHLFVPQNTAAYAAQQRSEAVMATIIIFKRNKVEHMFIQHGANQYLYQLSLDSQKNIIATVINDRLFNGPTSAELSDQDTVTIKDYHMPPNVVSALDRTLSPPHNTTNLLQTMMENNTTFQQALNVVESSLTAAQAPRLSPPAASTLTSSVLSSAAAPSRSVASAAASQHRVVGGAGSGDGGPVRRAHTGLAHPAQGPAQQRREAVMATISIFKRNNVHYVFIQHGADEYIYQLSLDVQKKVNATYVDDLFFAEPTPVELSMSGAVKIENYKMSSDIVSALNRTLSPPHDTTNLFQAIARENNTFHQAIETIQRSLIAAQAPPSPPAASSPSLTVSPAALVPPPPATSLTSAASSLSSPASASLSPSTAPSAPQGYLGIFFPNIVGFAQLVPGIDPRDLTYQQVGTWSYKDSGNNIQLNITGIKNGTPALQNPLVRTRDPAPLSNGNMDLQLDQSLALLVGQRAVITFYKLNNEFYVVYESKKQNEGKVAFKLVPNSAKNGIDFIQCKDEAVISQLTDSKIYENGRIFVAPLENLQFLSLSTGLPSRLNDNYAKSGTHYNNVYENVRRQILSPAPSSAKMGALSFYRQNGKQDQYVKYSEEGKTDIWFKVGFTPAQDNKFIVTYTLQVSVPSFGPGDSFGSTVQIDSSNNLHTQLSGGDASRFTPTINAGARSGELLGQMYSYHQRIQAPPSPSAKVGSVSFYRQNNNHYVTYSEQDKPVVCLQLEFSPGAEGKFNVNGLVKDPAPFFASGDKIGDAFQITSSNDLHAQLSRSDCGSLFQTLGGQQNTLAVFQQMYREHLQTQTPPQSAASQTSAAASSLASSASAPLPQLFAHFDFLRKDGKYYVGYRELEGREGAVIFQIGLDGAGKVIYTRPEIDLGLQRENIIHSSPALRTTSDIFGRLVNGESTILENTFANNPYLKTYVDTSIKPNLPPPQPQAIKGYYVFYKDKRVGFVRSDVAETRFDVAGKAITIVGTWAETQEPGRVAITYNARSEPTTDQPDFYYRNIHYNYNVATYNFNVADLEYLKSTATITFYTHGNNRYVRYKHDARDAGKLFKLIYNSVEDRIEYASSTENTRGFAVDGHPINVIPLPTRDLENLRQGHVSAMLDQYDRRDTTYYEKIEEILTEYRDQARVAFNRDVNRALLAASPSACRIDYYGKGDNPNVVVVTYPTIPGFRRVFNRSARGVWADVSGDPNFSEDAITQANGYKYFGRQDPDYPCDSAIFIPSGNLSAFYTYLEGRVAVLNNVQTFASPPSHTTIREWRFKGGLMVEAPASPTDINTPARPFKITGRWEVKQPGVFSLNRTSELKFSALPPEAEIKYLHPALEATDVIRGTTAIPSLTDAVLPNVHLQFFANHVVCVSRTGTDGSFVPVGTWKHEQANTNRVLINYGPCGRAVGDAVLTTQVPLGTPQVLVTDVAAQQRLTTLAAANPRQNYNIHCYGREGSSDRIFVITSDNDPAFRKVYVKDPNIREVTDAAADVYTDEYLERYLSYGKTTATDTADIFLPGRIPQLFDFLNRKSANTSDQPVVWISQYKGMVISARKGMNGEPVGEREVVGTWSRAGVNVTVTPLNPKSPLAKRLAYYKNAPQDLLGFVEFRPTSPNMLNLQDTRIVDSPLTLAVHQKTVGNNKLQLEGHHVYYAGGGVAFHPTNNRAPFWVGTWEASQDQQSITIDTANVPQASLGNAIANEHRYHPLHRSSDAVVPANEPLGNPQPVPARFIQTLVNERTRLETSVTQANLSAQEFDDWKLRIRDQYQIHPAMGHNPATTHLFDIYKDGMRFRYDKNLDIFSILASDLSTDAAKRKRQIAALATLQRTKHGDAKVVGYSAKQDTLNELKTAYRDQNRADKLTTFDQRQDFLANLKGRPAEPAPEPVNPDAEAAAKREAVARNPRSGRAR